MVDEKTQRVAYMRGHDAGYHKFEAEFETLLEVSESRLRTIDKLKANIKEIGDEAVNSETRRQCYELAGLNPHRWKLDGNPGMFDDNYKCSKCGATDSEAADNSYTKPEFGCIKS